MSFANAFWPHTHRSFAPWGLSSSRGLPSSPLVRYGASGLQQQTFRSDEEMFHDAYVRELAEFAGVVRGDAVPPVTGHDARNALRVALAAMTSYQENRAVRIEEVR